MANPLAKLTSTQRAWLYLGGGIGLVVGSFATWVKVTAVFVGTVTAAGTDGDGKITAVAGAIVVIGGAFVLKREPKRWLAVLGVLAGLVALGVAIYDLHDVYTTDVTSNFGGKTQKVGTVSAGWGLYLTFVASLAAIVGAALAVRGNRQVTPETF
jgi:hypothetical protein